MNQFIPVLDSIISDEVTRDRKWIYSTLIDLKNSYAGLITVLSDANEVYVLLGIEINLVIPFLWGGRI